MLHFGRFCSSFVENPRSYASENTKVVLHELKFEYWNKFQLLFTYWKLSCDDSILHSLFQTKENPSNITSLAL